MAERQNKGLVSLCECHCVRYQRGPATGVPWGPSGHALAECEGSLGGGNLFASLSNCQAGRLRWLQLLWLISRLEKSPTSEISAPS